MRVLVVSAHYPPNFVSGGTLVPFRSAAEFASRGHDVQVFAGWIGPAHASGEAFDDVHGDGSGVTVRWFTTNDAIDWTARLNFENPSAAADFASTLRAFAPDVVHFHSLQGLGAGLLFEADRYGVPFVVTAHDFWWWCGRQFLCDRSYHPCSPVVVAGVCECAVDREWLDERVHYTASALELASRVIAVSESSAAVLRANGVAPERLIVVDNPVEALAARAGATSRPSARSTASEEVRFVFAGGADPMKGLPVLQRALAELEKQDAVPAGPAGPGVPAGLAGPAWTADLYGVDGPAGTSGAGTSPSGSPSRVRFHPSFAPDDLSAVLSGADVLILPSVMQETYSILTREALAAGVPVITTTCLGPEEVIENGVNGLVVPQDDAGALADAMGRLVRDRALLSQLQQAARAVDLTTVRAHCDQLEGIYAAAAAAGRGGPVEGSRRSIRSVLFVVGIDGAPLRYRAHLPAEALALLGVRAEVRHYRDPGIVGLAASSDVIVLYRVPATYQVRAFVDDVRGRGTPVLFDVDDLIFDPQLEAEIPALKILSGAERDLWMEGVHRYRTTMELCDAFVGSTQVLCDHATTVTGLPARRFANGAGIVMSRLADEAVRRPRKPGPVRVGYLSGTDTHDHDWAMIEEAVVKTLDEAGDVELWLVGKLTPGPVVRELGDRLKLVPFQPWTALPELLCDLDVNLAPLVGSSRFNEAKSAIKWLEAALSATPTIASPTQPFREVVEQGVNGLLAGSAGEWEAALGALIADDVLRRKLGQRARRDALLRFGPWTQGRRYLEILQSVERRSSYGSAWQPVLLDEPFEPTALERYVDAGEAPPPAPGPDGGSGPRRTLARRAAASVKSRGLLETSVLAMRRVRKRLRGG